MPTEQPNVGRPQSFSREQAIDRAMQLFWREGFQAVTARDLAQAMGIQRSSFYNTFRTKEAVFAEALQRYGALAPDAALNAIAPGQPVISQIVAMVRRLCRLRGGDAERKGCLVCNSIAELVGTEAAIGAALETAYDERQRHLTRLFEQAVQQGEIELPDGAEEAASAFMVFLLGINLAAKTETDERRLWAASRLLLRGIGFTDAQLDEPPRAA